MQPAPLPGPRAMRLTSSALACLVLTAAAAGAGAQEWQPEAQGPGAWEDPSPSRYGRPEVDPGAAARQFRKLRVPGEEVARRVERLTGELHWHDRLASALREGRQSDRPVLWIQALGDIDGFL